MTFINDKEKQQSFTSEKLKQENVQHERPNDKDSFYFDPCIDYFTNSEAELNYSTYSYFTGAFNFTPLQLI